MASFQLEQAMTYLGYVIRRAGQSAETLRREIGDDATALEDRHQADLHEAREKVAREYLNNLEAN